MAHSVDANLFTLQWCFTFSCIETCYTCAGWISHQCLLTKYIYHHLLLGLTRNPETKVITVFTTYGS